MLASGGRNWRRASARRAAVSRWVKATGTRTIRTSPSQVPSGQASEVAPRRVTRRPPRASAIASFFTRVSLATSLATIITTCGASPRDPVIGTGSVLDGCGVQHVRAGAHDPVHDTGPP